MAHQLNQPIIKAQNDRHDKIRHTELYYYTTTSIYCRADRKGLYYTRESGGSGRS